MKFCALTAIFISLCALPVFAQPLLIKGESTNWNAAAIGGSSAEYWYSIYRAPVIAHAGDILHIEAEGQVRNDTNWRVECAQLLTVRPSADSAGNPPASFTNGTPSGKIGGTADVVLSLPAQGINGWDFAIDDLHYCRWSKQLYWTVPPEMDGQKIWIESRIRMRSSGADGGSQQNVAVQSNQGQLQVLVLPAEGY